MRTTRFVHNRNNLKQFYEPYSTKVADLTGDMMNSDTINSNQEQQGSQSGHSGNNEVGIFKVPMIPVHKSAVGNNQNANAGTMPPPPKYSSCLYTEYIPNKKFKKSHE